MPGWSLWSRGAPRTRVAVIVSFWTFEQPGKLQGWAATLERSYGIVPGDRRRQPQFLQILGAKVRYSVEFHTGRNARQPAYRSHVVIIDRSVILDLEVGANSRRDIDVGTRILCTLGRAPAHGKPDPKAYHEN